jgi:hypothetical protein
VEGRAWVTGKWRQVKLIDRNAVVGCSDIRGDTTTDYESFESSSQAFSFASAAYRWDIRFCCVINCLQSKGCAGRRSTGREAYLSCFVHFSISLAFVLENRIPALGAARLELANFRQGKTRQRSREREEQHTEIGRPSRRHNLAGCTPLEEDGILAGTSAERERADCRSRLVFIC